MRTCPVPSGLRWEPSTVTTGFTLLMTKREAPQAMKQRLSCWPSSWRSVVVCVSACFSRVRYSASLRNCSSRAPRLAAAFTSRSRRRHVHSLTPMPLEISTSLTTFAVLDAGSDTIVSSLSRGMETC